MNKLKWYKLWCAIMSYKWDNKIFFLSLENLYILLAQYYTKQTWYYVSSVWFWEKKN